mmetsp:Transcript_2105/g.6271  ORF Transcript_2105/g.6271 Transcript_2105/m.6271 type:complete len:293 (-) Transcript_2105:124-1002(-)
MPERGDAAERLEPRIVAALARAAREALERARGQRLDAPDGDAVVAAHVHGPQRLHGSEGSEPSIGDEVPRVVERLELDALERAARRRRAARDAPQPAVAALAAAREHEAPQGRARGRDDFERRVRHAERRRDVKVHEPRPQRPRGRGDARVRDPDAVVQAQLGDAALQRHDGAELAVAAARRAAAEVERRDQQPAGPEALADGRPRAAVLEDVDEQAVREAVEERPRARVVGSVDRRRARTRRRAANVRDATERIAARHARAEGASSVLEAARLLEARRARRRSLDDAPWSE